MPTSASFAGDALDHDYFGLLRLVVGAMNRTLRATSFVLLLAVLVLPGCGSAYYTISINAAESRLAQARAMGAETGAPYEYYYAREHLRKAQSEAAEASYGDAANYAETAEAYAQKAIDLVSAAKRSDGASK